MDNEGQVAEIGQQVMNTLLRIEDAVRDAAPQVYQAAVERAEIGVLQANVMVGIIGFTAFLAVMFFRWGAKDHAERMKANEGNRYMDTDSPWTFIAIAPTVIGVILAVVYMTESIPMYAVKWQAIKHISTLIGG